MAGLCWMAVTLGLWMSTGNSLAVVDQNQLAVIVDEVLNRYRPIYYDENGKTKTPMFSLAVTIPYNRDEKMYDISAVTDEATEVMNTITQRCEVYTGKRVVAATVLKWPDVLVQCPSGNVHWSDVLSKCPKKSMTWAEVNKRCPKYINAGRADHAEYRTLQHLNTLTQDFNKDDLLLFYVLASPCGKRCTDDSNKFNILESINQIKNWRNYAVVFSYVFKPQNGVTLPEEDLGGALHRLATYKGSQGPIGLSNIFRCNRMRCTSCSSGNEITRYCYSDETQSGQRDRDKKKNNINRSSHFSGNVHSRSGGSGWQQRGQGQKTND